MIPAYSPRNEQRHNESPSPTSQEPVFTFVERRTSYPGQRYNGLIEDLQVVAREVGSQTVGAVGSLADRLVTPVLDVVGNTAETVEQTQRALENAPRAIRGALSSGACKVTQATLNLVAAGASQAANSALKLADDAASSVLNVTTRALYQHLQKKQEYREIPKRTLETPQMEPTMDEEAFDGTDKFLHIGPVPEENDLPEIFGEDDFLDLSEQKSHES